LIEKAAGRTQMPPKHWIQLGEQHFFSAMSSVVPSAGVAVCKWQSGSSLNSAKGLPYISGLLMLNDIETGHVLSVMDSTWITDMRTAAASAIAARVLARPGAGTLAIIGCGKQGRLTLDAFHGVCPSINHVQAYDIRREACDQFVEDIVNAGIMNATPCKSAREAMQGADLVLTAGPIEPNAIRTIEEGWLEPGSVGVAIDYDCYWTAGAMQHADAIFTDDIEQLDHLREHGYFVHAPEPRADLGQILRNNDPGRVHQDEVFLVMNLGVSVEDATTARLVYDAGVDKGVGQYLEL